MIFEANKEFMENLSLQKKNEMLFKLLNLNSNLALTPGYLNPALNNSSQMSEGKTTKSESVV